MKMDAQINFRTSSEVKEQIEEIAKSRDIKPSQLINDIVADFLNRQGNFNTSIVNLETLHQMVVSQGQRIDQLEKKSAA